MVDWADIVQSPATPAGPAGGPIKPPEDGRSLSTAIGQLGGKFFDALGLGRATVQTGLGSMMPDDGTGQDGLARFKSAVDTTAHQWEGMNVPVLSGAMPILGPLATDIATDPLSYVGLGIPARAAAALAAAGKAPQVVRILEMLAKGDSATSAFMNWLPTAAWRGASHALTDIPLTKAGVVKMLPDAAELGVSGRAGAIPDALNSLAQKLPDINIPGIDNKLARVVPDVTAAGIKRDVVQQYTPDTLYEMLSGKTTETIFKNKLREFRDAIGRTAQNYPIERAITDESDAIAGKLLPLKGDQASFMKAKQDMTDLQSEFMDRIKTAPNAYARVAGAELARNVELANAQAWERAKVAVDEAGTRGIAPPPMLPAAKAKNWALAMKRQQYRDMYRQATDEIGQNYRAGFDVLEDIQTEAGRFAISAPEESALNRVFSKTMQDIESSQTLTQANGLFPIQQVSGRRLATDTIPDRMREVIARAQGVMQAGDRMQSSLPGTLPASLHLPEEVQGRWMNRMNQLDYLLHPQGWQPGSLANLPDQLSGDMLLNEKIIAKFGAQAAKDQNQFLRGLGEVYQMYVPGGMPAFKPTSGSREKDLIQYLNDRVAEINSANPGIAQIGNISGIADYMREIAPRTTIRESLQKLGEKYHGGDILASSPWELAYTRGAQALASQVGYKSPGALGDAARMADAMMKETMLTSTSFPLTNAISAIVMGQMNGVPASTVTRNLMQNFVKALRGEPIRINEDFYTRLGAPIHTASTAESSGMLDVANQSAKDYFRSNLTALQRVGSKKLAVAGGLWGGVNGALDSADPDKRGENIIHGALQGAAGGALLPVASQILVQRIGRGIEDVVRQSASSMASMTHVAAHREILDDIVDQALQTGWKRYIPPNPLTGAKEAVATARTPVSTQAAIKKWINDQEGVVSPEALQGFLGAHGVPRQIAKNAADTWRTQVDSALTVGDNLANKIHFDYTDLTNGEQLIRNVAPFSTWAVKAIPFFTQAMAEHPVIMSSLLAYSQLAERQRKEEGLTGRISGSVHVPMFDQLWSGLTGHPVQTYFNPLRGVLPFADTMRNLQQVDPDEDILQKVERYAQSAGLPGFHPLVKLLTSPIHDEPSQGVPIRQAAPIMGLGALAGINKGRGIDMTKAGTMAEDAMRQAFHNEPNDYENAAVMRRIDELAIRNTGTPITQGGAKVADYINAKATRSGPLWDQAMSEVRKDRGVRSLVGFGAQMLSPSALVTPEEAAIRKAQLGRVIDPSFADQLRDDAFKKPNAPPSAGTRQAIDQALDYMLEGQYELGHLQPGQRPPGIQALLDQNTNAAMNKIRGEIGAELVTRNPLSAGYAAGGSPSETALNNAMAQLSNQYAEVPGGDRLKGIQEVMKANPMTPKLNLGHGPDGQTQQTVRSREDAIKLQNPLVDRYYKAKLLNPNLNVEEFLRAIRNDPNAYLSAPASMP